MRKKRKTKWKDREQPKYVGELAAVLGQINGTQCRRRCSRRNLPAAWTSQWRRGNTCHRGRRPGTGGRAISVGEKRMKLSKDDIWHFPKCFWRDWELSLCHLDAAGIVAGGNKRARRSRGWALLHSSRLKNIQCLMRRLSIAPSLSSSSLFSISMFTLSLVLKIFAPVWGSRNELSLRWRQSSTCPQCWSLAGASGSPLFW